MIQTPADVFAALSRPAEPVKIRSACVWTMNNGDEKDFSDRLVRDGLGVVSRSIPTDLGAGSVTPIIVTLDNSDGALATRGGGGVFHDAAPEDLLGGPFELFMEVWGPSSGWYRVPVYTGRIQSIEHSGKTVDVKLEDEFTALLRRPLREAFSLDPFKSHAENLEDFLTTYTTLESADLDLSGSFAFAQARQEETDWGAIGTARQGARISTVAANIARSGLGTV